MRYVIPSGRRARLSSRRVAAGSPPTPATPATRAPLVATAGLVLAGLVTVGCADGAESPESPRAPLLSPELAVTLRIPEDDPGPPAYAEVSASFLPNDGTWAVINWWREPGAPSLCPAADFPPADFNLLLFLDLTPAFPGGPPRPLLCPLTIHGHVQTLSGSPPPAQEHYEGNGAVPVWFVRWSELWAAVDDDRDGIVDPEAGDALTIAELEALPSLLKGTASAFKEAIKNSSRFSGRGQKRPGSSSLVARGELEDGRSFYVHWSEKFVDGLVRDFNKVIIRFE